jgi:hypothetical protein
MAEVDFAAQVDEEDLAARRAAVEAIKPLYDWKLGEKNVEKEIRKIDPKGKDGRYDYGSSGVLRRWLMDHDEPLHDEEHGLVAEMRPGGSTEIYDAAAAIKERDEPLYRRLEELGCFSIDASAVKAAVQKGWLTASDVAPFKHSLERSPSLTVRKLNE